MREYVIIRHQIMTKKILISHIHQPYKFFERLLINNNPLVYKENMSLKKN